MGIVRRDFYTFNESACIKKRINDVIVVIVGCVGLKQDAVFVRIRGDVRGSETSLLGASDEGIVSSSR